MAFKRPGRPADRRGRLISPWRPVFDLHTCQDLHNGWQAKAPAPLVRQGFSPVPRFLKETAVHRMHHSFQAVVSSELFVDGV